MQQFALYATGYRPTSSEVAAEIEGFDDDFSRTAVSFRVRDRRDFSIIGCIRDDPVSFFAGLPF